MPRDKQVTRDAILHAALRLFAESNYASVRVEDLARAAGVSRATFYNHFGDRDDVLAALFERLLGSEVSGDDVAGDERRPPLERVNAVARDAVSRMLADEELARLLYRLPIRHEALLRPDEPATPEVFRTIHRLLEEARANGEVRDDVSIDLLCAHVHGALEDTMRAWAEGHAGDPLERVDVLVDLALFGVVKGGKRGSPPRTGRRRR